ncbi:ImmA/IrrE family metallo-endopeptidase [Actinosynnema sp. NPDC004786]
MSSVTWRYLSGDTATFAVELALVADQSGDWMVDADERASWGSLALWINGVNVCEHTVQGETIHAAHWYLLPIAEWLVEHWDALLHEERPPLVDRGLDAAQAFAGAALAVESDSHAVLDPERIQDWYLRHGLRSSAPGAILPDLFIRRYGDWVEFSTGREPLAGEDWGITFTQAVTASRLSVQAVADTLGDVLASLANVLLKRHPNRSRIEALRDSVEALSGASREAERVAWLSGAVDLLDRFKNLWTEVVRSVPDGASALASLTKPQALSTGLAIHSTPASLLFGSLAPDVSSGDVVAIYRALLERRGTAGSAADTLHQHGDVIRASWDPMGLSPGEQGSVYGQEAWSLLGEPDAANVDVEKVLDSLNVVVGHVSLSDPDVRAVSMIGDDDAAHILINDSYRRGTGPAVKRFTLAHELAHLLLDQDRATEIAVASGPWAPVDIEQRANAFAAAFLIPLHLVDRWWPAHQGRIRVDDLRVMANELGVSISAMVSRLQNSSRLSTFEADVLRAEMLDRAS